MTVPRYGRQDQSKNALNVPRYDDPDKKPVKMTEPLKQLKDIRSRKIEDEVEEEFQALADRKQQEAKNVKAGTSPVKKHKKEMFTDQDAFGDSIEEAYGFKREKSENLLLSS
mmetsp:Transcript_24251/g.23850  ORF Transcript_24251/g.23850 Transcript_24251/m.23850 type:complete len:112 (+) Transcript_24251:892-1227(+)